MHGGDRLTNIPPSTRRIALVTGGAGFIGSRVVHELIEKGFAVRILDDLSTGSLDRIASCLRVIGVEFIQGDVRDPQVVEQACEGVSLVFHLAALTSVPESLEMPHRYFDTNLTGTATVCHASATAGVARLVFASSAAVYGANSMGIVSECVEPRPLSPYGLTKLMGEQLLQWYATNTALDTASLRFFNVYGPGQSANSSYAAVIPAFIAAMVANTPPTIYGTGLQRRDFCFVSDIADACHRAAVHPSPLLGEVFNIGTGKPTSITGLFKGLAAVTLYTGEPHNEPERPGDIRVSCANPEKATRTLGFRAQTTLADGLRITVEKRGGKIGRASCRERV